MARISVVVPIYDVEDYLEECLRSLAGQTFADFEAVLVDDGSTDGSAAIAERFARRDPRFRLLRQANGGLSRARNAGIDVAGGEYLAFLDSDDLLPPDAYERLLGALERTGSDFATGNVERLTATGCSQAAFVASAFARTRLRTHVRRFAPLLADRTAWNKLWRRAFWDARGLRFPAGRLHEDIPVVLPAHYQAASVDVLSAPVYRYRLRDGGAPSITQSRHELRALRDRLAAVEQVHRYLAANESARQRRRYERSVVAHDLRYHLDLLADCDDEYRELFMQWAGAFLAAAGPRVCEGLPAGDRARYHLVRHGRLEELLALLEFQRDDALRTPPRRVRGRYYADYPAPSLPRSSLRLGRRDRELALAVQLEDLRYERGRLRLAGHAYVNALGAATPDAQRVEIAAVRPGGQRALRMRLAPRRLATVPERRDDLEPRLRWAGFQASIAPAALLEGDRWELFAYVRTGGVSRRRAVFAIDDPALARTVDLPVSSSVLMQARLGADGRAAVTVATRWVRIDSQRRIGNQVLELSGEARLEPDAAAALELTLADGDATLGFPLTVERSTFRVQVDLPALRAAAARPEADWRLSVVAASRPPGFALAEHLHGSAWRSGGCDMALARTSDGGALLSDHLRPARMRAPASFETSAPVVGPVSDRGVGP